MLIAACRRGDETERLRLIETAPRVGYRLPDYIGFADALQTVVLIHLADRLDLGARFWLVLALLESEHPDDSPRRRKQSERLEGTVGAAALRFCIEVDGWKLFCEGLDLEPDGIIAELPAFRTAEAMETLARQMASTPEEANAYLRKECAQEAARLPTADDVAESYRKMLAMGEGPWH